MIDNDLKLKVKSELKLFMPTKLLLEILKENNINTSLGKQAAIDSILQSYTAEEVEDIILKKYDEKETYSRSKERFLKTINRKSAQVRKELKNKEEKEKKNKIHPKIRKNKEREEIIEKELEEERIKDNKRKAEDKKTPEQKKKIHEETQIHEKRTKEIENKRLSKVNMKLGTD